MNSFRALTAALVNRFQSRKILRNLNSGAYSAHLAPVAEHEREAISQRTKAALQAAKLAVYALAATFMESDLRRGLGWPAQHAMVNVWMISAFIFDCARAAVAPVDVGAQGLSRRA